MFLEKYSLLYCWIHKAASSSWNRVFFEMSNTTVPEDDFLHAANHIFRPRDSVSRQHLLDNAAVSFALSATHSRGLCQPTETSLSWQTWTTGFSKSMQQTFFLFPTLPTWRARVSRGRASLSLFPSRLCSTTTTTGYPSGCTASSVITSKLKNKPWKLPTDYQPHSLN